MISRPLLAAALVLAIAPSAHAVQLVVMSTNTTAVAGAKVFTIGVKVAQSDVTAPGTGSAPELIIRNVTFTGDGTNPVQGPGANNKVSIQAVQAILGLIVLVARQSLRWRRACLIQEGTVRWKTSCVMPA